MDFINMRFLVCFSLVHLATCITLTTQPSPTSPTEMKTEPDNVMQEAHPAISVIKPGDDGTFNSKRSVVEHFGRGPNANNKISARSYQPVDQPYQFYMPIVQNGNDVQSNKIEPTAKYSYYVPAREDAVAKDENDQNGNGQGGYPTGKSQLYPVLNNQLFGKSLAVNPASLLQGMVPNFGGVNPMFASNHAAHLGMNPLAAHMNALMPNLGGVHSFYGGMQPQMQPIIILNFGGYQNPAPMMGQFKYPQYNYQLLYSMMQNQLANQASTHPQQTQAIFRSDNLHSKTPFVPSSPFNPEHAIKKQDSAVPKTPAQATEAVMDPRHLSGENYQHGFNKYAHFNEKVSSV